MSYFFGDGFDLYALPADAYAGYWDSGTAANFQLVSGRFAGSRALMTLSNSASWVMKSSGVNESVHHIVVAVWQGAAISGTSLGIAINIMDGATSQCTIVFRSDGAILLTSGGSGGSALATYTGAITASSTWYAFEFEVVIHNTAGSFAVRKNGNTSNDFSATSLNTRGGTANNYANRTQLGGSTGALAANQAIDDFLWRSDASSVPWVGDVRCYTRRPDTDASAAWTRQSTFQMQPYFGATTTTTIGSAAPRYSPFVSQGGAIGSVVVNLSAGYTGNMKCTIFASTIAAGGGQPGAILQSATAPINNPTTANTFTFSPPVSIAKGSQFFVGIATDTLTGSILIAGSAAPYNATGFTGSVSYASFPTASPSVSTSANVAIFPVVTPAYNADAVADSYEDAAASYVYSANVNDTDQYTLTGTSSVPTTVVGVTTRGLFQKSDAGTRNAVVQLKSGGTTVESASTALSSSGWGWIYRSDLTDPATGVAWTPSGVSTAQVGARVAA